MKKAFIVLSIFIFASIMALFNFGSVSKAGETSELVAGMLLKCPDKPNCVCSEYKNDANHYTDPISISQDIPFDLFSLLKNVIHDMGGEIQIEKGNYLAATFTSAIFKFVDDLEIRIDSTQRKIHIRSASRFGYSDFGVNKKRVKLLKELLSRKILEADNSLQ